MRWLAMTLLFALGCGAAAPIPDDEAGDPIERARQGERPYCEGEDPATVFTCDVAQRMRAAVDGVVVRARSAFTVVVETPTGDSILQANLDNLWHGCRARPDDCEQAKDYYAAMAAQTLSQLHSPDAPTRDNVRAVLKSSTWLADATAHGQRIGDEILSRPFVADIVIVYVVDMPNSMRALTRADLPALEASEDDLYEIALQNLAAALPDIPRRPIQDGSTIGAVSAGDSYEASRLLLHESWRAVAAEVEGELVVAAPSRDVVLYAGAGRADDLETLRTLALQMSEREPYAVSAVLLRWAPGGWEPYAP